MRERLSRTEKRWLDEIAKVQPYERESKDSQSRQPSKDARQASLPAEVRDLIAKIFGRRIDQTH